MSQDTEFEKWFNSIGEIGDGYYKVKNIARASWKASEIEINSLKERVTELEADLDLLKPHPKCDMGCMLACNMEGNAITELQADNNRLRDLLEYVTNLIK